MKGKAGELSEALRGRRAGPCRLFQFQKSTSARVGPLRIQRDALKTVDGQCHPPSRRQSGRQTSESRWLRHAGQEPAQDHEEETQSGPRCPAREKDGENAGCFGPQVHGLTPTHVHAVAGTVFLAV